MVSPDAACFGRPRLFFGKKEDHEAVGLILMPVLLALPVQAPSAPEYEITLPAGCEGGQQRYPALYVLPQDGFLPDDSGLAESLPRGMPMLMVRPGLSPGNDVPAVLRQIIADFTPGASDKALARRFFSGMRYRSIRRRFCQSPGEKHKELPKNTRAAPAVPASRIVRRLLSINIIRQQIILCTPSCRIILCRNFADDRSLETLCHKAFTAISKRIFCRFFAENPKTTESKSIKNPGSPDSSRLPGPMEQPEINPNRKPLRSL